MADDMAENRNEESETDVPAGTGQPTRVAQLLEQFDAALDQLERAPDFSKARYQTPVFRLAADLLESDAGLHGLYQRAAHFDRAGVFHGGPWEDPSKLLPHLVGIGLMGETVYPTVESLSELRLLALATGGAESERMDAAAARDFLRDVSAKCLDLAFPRPSESTRRRPRAHARAERLLALIRAELPLAGLRERVIEEIELMAAQRPIVIGPIVQLVHAARRLAGDTPLPPELEQRLLPFENAVKGASALSRECIGVLTYRRAVSDADTETLRPEAEALGRALRATGLGSPHHAVLLRRLGRDWPEGIAEALQLDETGRAEMGKHGAVCQDLIRVAVQPATAFCIYGLARMLERGLLSRTEVQGGLKRLIDFSIRPDVRETLLAGYPPDSGLSANAVLLAGAIAVLGQPLGIGQGNNPTCQSARALSLWSLHAPGYLLKILIGAARDGCVEMDFEGIVLRSNELLEVPSAASFDTDLDPASVVLVPHLNRIYARMLQLAGMRGEDAHRWVNPAMYGRWIPKGFASAMDPLGLSVVRFRDFVRRFFATHHPEFNDGRELLYPNPVGIFVTDVHAAMLGPHAVSIQRVARDPSGAWRLYFYNPNNEGRQDWGGGVRPSVHGAGEIPGESSLPFGLFASRLYAFHFNPREEGDAFAVPATAIDPVVDAARSSWGAAFEFGE